MRSRPVKNALHWLFYAALAWVILTAGLIMHSANQSSPKSTDAAIILGAAIYTDRPSPVFEERIRHGITLYKSGRVKRLIFTGGFGEGKKMAEAQVARDFALKQGVPAPAILIETRSRTTSQNLVEAIPLMRVNDLHSALIVSDPLHMHRAMIMSEGLGMNAAPSPTPTSRYRSFKTRAEFLISEVWFVTVYRLAGI